MRAPPDDEPLRLRVRELLRQLRTDPAADAAAIAAELAPLATHDNARIRQPVAEACEFLPDPPAEALLATLARDRDAYVHRAAQRSEEQRAAKRRSARKHDEHRELAADLHAEIEERAGRAVAKRSREAARREAEFFVGRLHHEVNKIMTPLATMIARARSELRRQPVDAARVDHELEVVQSRLDFLWSVVDAANGTAARVRSTATVERPWAIVEEAKGQLLLALGEDAARVRFQNDVDDRLELTLHRHPLLQALQNVLQNAAEAYAPDAPIEIHVSMKVLRTQAELSVRDRGAGMTEDQREHLFTPFGSRKPRGRGLGMIVVRKMIAEVHGGELHVESARGVGTTVRMTLPIKRTRS